MEVILLTATNGMDEVIGHYEKEISKIRTGRANPNILDGVNIKCYGSIDALSNNAQIKIADAHQLLIKPYDRNLLKDITAAITKADLKVQIKNEAETIRLIFPQLTEEVRKSLVKKLAHVTEECKVKIRNVRREAVDALKKMKLPEDEQRSGEKKIQKLTDDKINHLVKIEENKVAELMKI